MRALLASLRCAKTEGSVVALTINGRRASFNGDPEMPLLWYLREQLKVTGPKPGCMIGQCRACTVHINGEAQPSCLATMGTLEGAQVTTIEALSPDGTHPVQRAWVELDVAQCGYCQAGQIMAAADLLKRIPEPTDDDIDREMLNICRCGTYVRVRKAIHRAAELMKQVPMR
jgi:isoquinoline 1-oxidoreductase subunit alpha